jgi:predicted RNA-binding Zn-ribbon protein involved in translation (DUF1610 family)
MFPKHERQCITCGFIYEMDHWAPVKTFECPHCRNREVKSDTKAVKSLKRMKKKLGVKAS